MVPPSLKEVSALKIRIRFAKQGAVKFIGHLDMVRYFQKVMRRANVDIVYSEGFSPHQKMSFAAPLSVGITSKGEYFDIEVNSSKSSKKMIKSLNEQNVDGVEILSYKLLPDNAKNAMAVLAGADYFVYTNLFSENIIENFMKQPEIHVLKKTKKSQKIVNIKPMIYTLQYDNNGIFMKVAQGSSANLKPDLVIQALSQFADVSLPEFIQYERLDMYCTENGRFISLDDIGGCIE